MSLSSSQSIREQQQQQQQLNPLQSTTDDHPQPTATATATATEDPDQTPNGILDADSAAANIRDISNSNSVKDEEAVNDHTNTDDKSVANIAAASVPTAPDAAGTDTDAIVADNDGDDSPRTFPQILMEILCNEEHSDIISWLPGGRAFTIYKKKKFAATVLPKYFKATKFTSFTRKLNRWGFNRVTRGPEQGSYWHTNFLRDQPDLCLRMSSNISTKYHQAAAAIGAATTTTTLPGTALVGGSNGVGGGVVGGGSVPVVLAGTGIPTTFPTAPGMVPGLVPPSYGMQFQPGMDIATQSHLIQQQVQALQWQQYQLHQMQMQQQQAQHQQQQQQQPSSVYPDGQSTTSDASSDAKVQQQQQQQQGTSSSDAPMYQNSTIPGGTSNVVPAIPMMMTTPATTGTTTVAAAPTMSWAQQLQQPVHQPIMVPYHQTLPTTLSLQQQPPSTMTTSATTTSATSSEKDEQQQQQPAPSADSTYNF